MVGNTDCGGVLKIFMRTLIPHFGRFSKSIFGETFGLVALPTFGTFIV
jgi:hypothetical protein